MAKVITFAHYKGGTGKTTSCINIAGYLAKSGAKVLAVDLDPQGNLTAGLGIDKDKVRYSSYHIMDRKINIKYSIVDTGIKNLHLVPANMNLAKASLKEYNSKSDAKILSDALEQVKGHYDYILIDTPPNNAHFIVNGVTAADSTVLVLDPGIFAVEAIDNFKNVYTNYTSKIGLNMNIDMAILTKCQPKLLSLFKKKPEEKIKQSVSETINKDVFMVPYSNAVFESQVKGLPLSDYKPLSNAGRAYLKIAQSIITKQ